MTYPPSRIEVFKPSITEEEIDAVSQVMRSGWIGRGLKVEEFESEWARHIGVPRENVVSVGCATEGLYQVINELYWNYENAHVVIPDNAFIGTASAVLESSMELKLCDIDRHTLNPDISHYSEQMGPRTAIVYQHYGGFGGLAYAHTLNEMCDMWDAPLIEDLACAPMTKPVGDFAIWSFDAMKVLTCGDGGMVYCRDVEAAQAIRQATRLGMDTASGQSSLVTDRWWEFTAHVPGRRSMMNDIGAAIGLVQLRRLPEMVEKRQSRWEYYQEQLADIDWLTRPPDPRPMEPASYYTYWVQCDHRDELARHLRTRGVYTSYRYWPISKAYNWDVNCPNSHWAAAHTLNLPLHPGLSGDDIDYVCEAIVEFGRTL